ncbi:hypothetical protein QR721_11200 [Aciduricibacillus chroicocephali]|uniref:Uncharacterized protein n=1 Tax=Aciduricibacillus chroicocephali TaxID=3054939 RepID=A0ABY9KTZ0_9BACI|nr:hypothetical protein QR721_11200 [Bacillaceae bacterium 44XB]
MLKIDERIKWKELPRYISEQLSFVDIFNIKAGIAIAVFVMVDLFMIIPLLIPLVPIYLYILLPPLIIINIWGVWIIVRNPYSVQYETILILAAMGIFASPTYLILAHKMAYYHAGIHSWSYYVIVTLVYVITTLWILQYRLNRFKDLSYETLVKWKKEEGEQFRGKGARNRKFDGNKYMAIILYVPAIGYLIAQGIKHNEAGVAITLILSFLGLASFFSYAGIKFTHRLFMMKANPQLVVLRTPSKSKYRNGIVKRDQKIK